MEISSGLKNESQCANLVLWTRRSNEPCFRVRQGRLILKNMEVNHFSSGIDIWNGNAALQIQPPADTNGMPLEANPPQKTPNRQESELDNKLQRVRPCQRIEEVRGE